MHHCTAGRTFPGSLEPSQPASQPASHSGGRAGRRRTCALSSPHNNEQESKMISLEVGEVYRVRYATENGGSTQRRGVRRIEVVAGPHRDARFRHGPIVTVKDLSDPRGARNKTMYCDRFLTIQHESSQEEAESTEQHADGLAVGDLVSVDRRETPSGEVLGKIVRLSRNTASIRGMDSRRTTEVRRCMLSRTSLATIKRKSARQTSFRRHQMRGASIL